MEWKWHTADRASGEFDENLAILRAALKALQSLTSPSASSSLSLEEIAHESLEEYHQKKKATADGEQKLNEAADSESNLSVATTSAPVMETKKNNNLNSFMARLEKKANISDSFAKKPAEKVEPVTIAPAAMSVDEEENAPAPAVEGEEKALVSAGEDEEKAPVGTATEEGPSAGPAYPKSFNEVMEMLQKGEKVPGIKDIEEKISVDSEEYLKSAAATSTEDEEEVVARPSAPSKPWEKVQG